jgi:3-hydroxybutyryl-CoA dehydrogenase
MNLLVVGNDAAHIECKARLGDAHQYFLIKTAQERRPYIGNADAVFDFSENHETHTVEGYARARTMVFLNTAFTTLEATLGKISGRSIFGFCGLPTFFNRPVLEVALPLDREKPDDVCKSLGLEFISVKDQVGFVTPRVVCMIINEAYDALKSGVASRADIDLSMKLGTNYPFGPFEWSERIGVDNVRKLLNAVFFETKDNRYKPVI